MVETRSYMLGNKWFIKSGSIKKPLRDTESIFSEILKARKVGQSDSFINPGMSDISFAKALVDPKEVAKGVSRIKKAIKREEMIIVWTDYDADGVCAGAIIWEALFKLKAKCIPYIPRRDEEGYGLSEHGIEKIRKEKDAKLIICLDNGVTKKKEISFARSLGIDTIVIDHHEIIEEKLLPLALIHSVSVSAGTLAWLFSRELLKETGQFSENLDLAALSTVSDLMNLSGINRSVVKFGLKELNRTVKPGLMELIRQSGILPGSITSRDIAFILAPRLNAPGRLDDAMDSLRLLCTKDKIKAVERARLLCSLNRKRQVLTNEAFEISRQILADMNRQDKTGDNILAVSHESFHPGVIGLVSAKLTGRYNRPSIVISEKDKKCFGSARSVEGFDIHAFISGFSGMLEDFGGHKMAAGFNILKKNLNAFKKSVSREGNNKYLDTDCARRITIDAFIKLSSVTDSLFEKIALLEPFGKGNPEPVFAAGDLRVTGKALVGAKKDHLILNLQTLDNDKVHYRALGWGMGKIYGYIEKEASLAAAFTLKRNRYKGRTELNLVLNDVIIR